MAYAPTRFIADRATDSTGWTELTGSATIRAEPRLIAAVTNRKAHLLFISERTFGRDALFVRIDTTMTPNRYENNHDGLQFTSRRARWPCFAPSEFMHEQELNFSALIRSMVRWSKCLPHTGHLTDDPTERVPKTLAPIQITLLVMLRPAG